MTKFFDFHLRECKKLLRGLVFDIKRGSIEDGPGIRTVIFLKGCPLNCLWCHSPESMKKLPELVFYKNKCILCGKCVIICPYGAQELIDNKRIINRNKCHNCGLCAQVCDVGALEIKGKYFTVDEILEEIKKDIVFFRNSGGGVTFSGGEPTFQPKFLLSVLKRCKEEGISTALDTSGFVKWDILKEIIKYTYLLLYDIKHMDSLKHQEYTGVSNKLILENLNRIRQHEKKEVRIRLPIIPGYNDSELNIKKTGNYLGHLGIKNVDLLLYNEMAKSKYIWIDKEFKMPNIKHQEREYLKTIKDALGLFCLNVKII